MKRFATFTCCLIVVAFNSCERHDVSELQKIEEQPAPQKEAKATGEIKKTSETAKPATEKN